MKNNANAPIYEHLNAEEYRLELERTREELRQVKKQLAERDVEILQLQTAHRKLQDTLRKKDRDLQSIFSVLRAPLDAELTKKRKSELVERLLMETQQRVLNAEAVAEERKRELDKLKFSSKFLRYQELDVEIEECHREIERLCSQLSQYTIVGKLKITKKPGPMDGIKTPGKTPRRQLSGNQRDVTHSSDQVIVPIVPQTVVLDTSTRTSVVGTKRDTFVTRTRRRAVEAEYQKQIRLAQLEAECELEENLRILAKREAAAQAEIRRQKAQEGQRQSRARRVDISTTASNPPAEVGSACIPKCGEANDVVSTSMSERIDTTPEASSTVDTVSEGVGEAIPDPVVIIETPKPQEAPLSAEEAKEPKQYDEDGFDDGPDDVHGSIDNARALVENYIQGEEEHEEDIDDNTIAEDVKETVPIQGFLVDPINHVEVPSSLSWQQISEAKVVANEPYTAELSSDDVPEADNVEETENVGLVLPPVDGVQETDNEEEVQDEIQRVELVQGFLVDPENHVDIFSVPSLKQIDPVAVEIAMDIPKQGFQMDIESPGSTIAVGGTEGVEDPDEYTREDQDQERRESVQDIQQEPSVPAPIDGNDIVEETKREDNHVSDEEVDEKDDENDVLVIESTTPQSSVPSARPLSKDPSDVDPPNVTNTVAMEAVSHLEDGKEATQETLHACDDVIVATSDLLRRQIDSALAEPIRVDPSPANANDPLTRLSPDDLALAMDAAARKIQHFWRDMATKYDPPRINTSIDSTEIPTSEAISAVTMDVTAHETIIEGDHESPESPVVY